MSRSAMVIGTAAHLAIMSDQGEMVEIKPRNQGKTEIVTPDNNIPNRLSIERGSRFYTPVGSYIGVKLDGEDVSGRVVEFNRIMGWVRLVDPVLSGKPLGAREVNRAIRYNGVVETYWRMKPSRQIRRQLARIG